MASKSAISRGRPSIPVLMDKECHDTPICASVVGSIRRVAIRKGYSARMYSSCEELQNDAFAGDTVIVIGFESSRMQTVLQSLEAQKKRIVVTGIDADYVDFHYSCATFSRRIATEQMLDFFMQKGCCSVAMVGVGYNSMNDAVRSEAMRRYSELSGGLLHSKSFSYQTYISESFESFLKEADQFDAVLCPNDYAAVAFLHFCEEHQIKVPDQLILASFNGNRIGQYCRPAITSLMINFEAIGESAVTIWLYLQENHNLNLQFRITAPGRILERESTHREGTTDAAPPLRRPMNDRFEGGPFYEEPSLQALMRIDRCIQRCDELDFRIIGELLTGDSYETIAGRLFLSESSMQYRMRKLFQVAQVANRRAFAELFDKNFPHHYCFEPPKHEEKQRT